MTHDEWLNLTEDELIKMAWEAYEQEMASRDTRDYELNGEQFQKLIDAYKFFCDYVEANDGEIEPFRIVPTEVHGGITVCVDLLYLHGEMLEQFCRILSGASAISIDSKINGKVCISINIPNVYKKRTE